MLFSFLDSDDIEQIDHSAYSPDLAPNDFWLIRKLKLIQTYRTEDELSRSYQND